MKKKFLLLLTLILSIVTLSGCYTADTTVKFGMNGKIKVSSEIIGNAEALKSITSQESGYEDMINEQLTSYKEFYDKTPSDAKTAVFEPISKNDANGQPLYGAKAELTYNNLNQLLNSQLLSVYTQLYPLTSKADQENSISINEDPSFFGTTYKANGNITITGQFGEPSEELKGQLSSAYIRYAFEFPASIIKHNAPKTERLGTRLVWTATLENPANISFSVFVPNPILVLLSFIVIILLIIIIMLLSSKKKIMVLPTEGYKEGSENNEEFVDDTLFETNELEMVDGMEDDEDLSENAEIDEDFEIEEVEEDPTDKE